MEGNDLLPYSAAAQAAVFEGLIAHLPDLGFLTKSKYSRAYKAGKWEEVLHFWVPHEIALKSLIDSVNRRGIRTDIYTFFPADAVDAVYAWLVRKGVHTAVYSCEGVEEIKSDLKYNFGIRRVFVADENLAKEIGMRATCVTPKTQWLV
jgi:hypothetical protein